MHSIIALWAHPRSLSTALERVFIERGDFTVMHEPFSVVYYLHERRARAVQANLQPDDVADYATVRQRVLRAAEHRPVCFKDMCYHCHDHVADDPDFLRRLKHVFLIRDPRQAIASHYAQNPSVTSEEIGYEQQASLLRRVSRLDGTAPTVLAAEDLQRNPQGTLQALCRRLGLEYLPEALRWQPRQLPEWAAWREWHGEVATSREIDRRKTNYAATVDNHTRLGELYRDHRPFYEEMKPYCLTPDTV